MTVYVIDSYENMPYGEHMGIHKVFISYEKAKEYLEKYDGDYYSLSIHEMETEDELIKSK